MLRPLLNWAKTKLMWQNFGLVLKYDVCCGLQHCALSKSWQGDSWRVMDRNKMQLRFVEIVKKSYSALKVAKIIKLRENIHLNLLLLNHILVKSMIISLKTDWQQGRKWQCSILDFYQTWLSCSLKHSVNISLHCDSLYCRLLIVILRDIVNRGYLCWT